MGDWTIRLIDETGYVGIFLLMFLETIFPPIPSEVIMPIAGVRAAQGPLTLWAVIASGTGRGDARQPLLVCARAGDRPEALPAVHREATAAG